jgi:cysteine desulfurase
VYRSIYLDHAATTAVDPRVVQAMLPYFSDRYGNPSAVHRLGQHSQEALVSARHKVADILGAQPDEIVFTGCGSESDNLALRGVFLAQRAKGNHLITSAIEHPAILQTCEQLADPFGAEVTVLPVDQYGRVDPAAVEAAITPRTILVSIMYANNEVGTIEPIASIAKIAHAHGVLFHTDAVQAGGQLPLDVNELGIDLLSLSAHKFYGPKGVGVLYVRHGTPLLPLLTGGGQERGYRSGTENVPYIVGLATALDLAYRDREAKNRRFISMRDALIKGVLSAIPGSHLTGHPTERLPNSASFCFDGASADALLINLDLAGVAASSGSACHAGSVEPSSVLTAMGIARERAVGALRLTLGNENEPQDVEQVLSLLPPMIERLRVGMPASRRNAAVHAGQTKVQR